MLHLPEAPFAYEIRPGVLRLIVRVAAGAISGGEVAYNDRYAWEGESWAPLVQRAALWRYAHDGELEYWATEVRLARPRFRYRFGLDGGDGRRWYGFDGVRETPDPVGTFEFPYLAEGDRPDAPAWANGAVFYHVFPDRFARGRDAPRRRGLTAWHRRPTNRSVFGGDLDGITERIPYLRSLGVDALYLTPVFSAPSNHKYDTADFFEVDPAFGGNAALRRLVSALHAEGMRLCLDGVFNHVGRTWPPFVDVERHGLASRYARWFHLEPDYAGAAGLRADGSLGYETWATDVASLPKLRTSEPELRSVLLRVGRFWVEEFGIDGWRLDVADEVDHRFWRDFRRVVREAGPEAFLFGEIWYPAMPWLRGDQLDSVMDYPVRRAILGFAGGDADGAHGFLDAIDRVRATYPEPLHTRLYNLLGSHDAERPLTALGGDRRRFALASALLFLLPGIASVYYGDEVGMEGGDDPDCRRGMLWDEGQDRTLLGLYRTLGGLRRRSAALRIGRYQRLLEDGPVAAFARETEEERVIVIANAGRDEARVAKSAVAPGGSLRVATTLGYDGLDAAVRRDAIMVPASSAALVRVRVEA